MNNLMSLEETYGWQEFPESPGENATSIEFVTFMIEVAEEYARRVSPHHILHGVYTAYAINLRELLHRMEKEEAAR